MWCERGDLNPHGCPRDPKSRASASSATLAQWGCPRGCRTVPETAKTRDAVRFFTVGDIQVSTRTNRWYPNPASPFLGVVDQYGFGARRDENATRPAWPDRIRHVRAWRPQRVSRRTFRPCRPTSHRCCRTRPDPVRVGARCGSASGLDSAYACGPLTSLRGKPRRQGSEAPPCRSLERVLRWRLLRIPGHGEVREWTNRHAWKACVSATGPWVRIPPSPPSRQQRVLRTEC